MRRLRAGALGVCLLLAVPAHAAWYAGINAGAGFHRALEFQGIYPSGTRMSGTAAGARAGLEAGWEVDPGFELGLLLEPLDARTETVQAGGGDVHFSLPAMGGALAARLQIWRDHDRRLAFVPMLGYWSLVGAKATIDGVPGESRLSASGSGMALAFEGSMDVAPGLACVLQLGWRYALLGPVTARYVAPGVTADATDIRDGHGQPWRLDDGGGFVAVGLRMRFGDNAPALLE